jgi:curved DNA-binding protein CbpA
MAAKKTLYQVLGVARTATPEALKAAYAARLSALGERATPEVHAERTLLREAYEALSDPDSRRSYDDRLRDDALRALSSGGEEVRARPANARLIEADPLGASSSPFGWMIGIAAVLVVGVGAGWVYLDHKRRTEELRLAQERQAEMARLREAAAQRFDNTMDWAKQRIDKDRETAEYRRQEAQRQRERQQWQYEQDRIARQNTAEAARAAADQRRADYEQQRLEQENLRRAQQQLERDRRHLQELERNRAFKF